jgi:SAM-dependent methyltransferase
MPCCITYYGTGRGRVHPLIWALAALLLVAVVAAVLSSCGIIDFADLALTWPATCLLLTAVSSAALTLVKIPTAGGIMGTTFFRPAQQSSALVTNWWFETIAPQMPEATEWGTREKAREELAELRLREQWRPSTVLKRPAWPAAWPFVGKDLTPRDMFPDSVFYRVATFQSHVDDNARASLADWYGKLPVFGERKAAPAACVLDLASSWQSHYPAHWRPDVEAGGKAVGVGMSLAELQRNPQLSECVVQDLNKNPALAGIPDGSFDLVTCALSIDYFTDPHGVLSEACRMLKPGGSIALSFSNRCFPTKVIAMVRTLTNRPAICSAHPAVLTRLMCGSYSGWTIRTAGTFGSSVRSFTSRAASRHQFAT